MLGRERKTVDRGGRITTRNTNSSMKVEVPPGSHLRPRSFFSVPPYLGLVPIKSIISGIQLANIAYTPADKQQNKPHVIHHRHGDNSGLCRARVERGAGSGGRGSGSGPTLGQGHRTQNTLGQNVTLFTKLIEIQNINIL